MTSWMWKALQTVEFPIKVTIDNRRWGVHGTNAKSWNPRSEKAWSGEWIAHWSNLANFKICTLSSCPGTWGGWSHSFSWYPFGSVGAFTAVEVMRSQRPGGWTLDFIFWYKTLLSSVHLGVLGPGEWMFTLTKLEKIDLSTSNTSLNYDSQCICHGECHTWRTGQGRPFLVSLLVRWRMVMQRVRSSSH